MFKQINIFVFLLSLLFPAQSDAGVCLLLWDMALVSRAMVEEGIEPGKIVNTMDRIYRGPRELSGAMVEQARLSTLPAMTFADGFKAQCNAVKSGVPKNSL